MIGESVSLRDDEIFNKGIEKLYLEVNKKFMMYGHDLDKDIEEILGHQK